jgi:hypothetical protein
MRHVRKRSACADSVWITNEGTVPVVRAQIRMDEQRLPMGTAFSDRCYSISKSVCVTVVT